MVHGEAGHLPDHIGEAAAYLLTCYDSREDCLHALGYTDIFKAVKDTENTAALELLPKVEQHPAHILQA